MKEKRQRGYIWRHQHSGKSLRSVAKDLGISTDKVRELYDEELKKRLHEGENPY